MTDHYQDERPIDFSPFAVADRLGEERLARAIAARAAPLLAGRRARGGVPPLLLWRRPALAAAALIAVVGLSSVWRMERSPASPLAASAVRTTAASAVSAAGVPGALAHFVGAGRTPRAADVLLALQGYGR